MIDGLRTSNAGTLSTYIVLNRGHGVSTSWAASDVTEGILNHIWLDWCQSLSELSEAQLGIAIQVEATHDSRQFLFDRLVSNSFEETTDRKLVNDLVIVVVNCLEGTSDAETLKLLQVLLQLFQSQFEINFFGQENCEFFFDEAAQVFVTSCPS